MLYLRMHNPLLCRRIPLPADLAALRLGLWRVLEEAAVHKVAKQAQHALGLVHGHLRQRKAVRIEDQDGQSSAGDAAALTIAQQQADRCAWHACCRNTLES